MYESLHCLALRTVRHDDRTSILSAWTAECGRVGISMPAGTGREAQRRRALTMPLAIFEGVVVSRPGRDLVRLRDLRPVAVTSSLHSHPVKTAMALFLADVADGVLRASEPDARLSDFLFGAVRALDALTDTNAVANFHLWFLRALATMTGIAPDFGSWRPGAVFDMTEGVFRVSPPVRGRYLMPDEARAVCLLGRLTLNNIARVRLSRSDRRLMLDGILDYYAMHGAVAASATRSLDILKTLF
ncbi:MAG: DNA repair protein RecO C-terminal domain-containing protein [Muribaculaceae bacterium]|nr:DNA repair protein RecO C-terminal domain-containing protein [Muribaculaceae bacterium]